MKFDKSWLLLYAVTDRTWVGHRNLYEQVEESLKGGITLLQMREKDMEEWEFIKEATDMKELAHRYQVPFIINDSVQVALRCGADGVHVGQSDMEAGDVRMLLGEDKILGVTAKTVEQAIQAQARGADYLGAGAVFGSTTKTDAKFMDMDTLKAICEAVTIPVVAIGGITAENIVQLKGSGVCGAAVVSSVFAKKDICAATKELLKKAEEIMEDSR